MRFLDVDWTLAECTDKPLNLFFSLKTKEIEEAKGLCAICPIRTECLEYSLVNQEYGLWGGLLRHERQLLYPDSYANRQEQESQKD